MTVLLFYLGLGMLLAFEEAGVFLLPGDISLVAAGLRGVQGDSNVFVSWLVASAGMITGASVLFHAVSRSQGAGRVLPQRVRELIQTHGVWGLSLARLVPGLRNATVFAAASAHMPYRQFLYGLIPAALIWSGALLCLGWFGGDAMLAAFGALHHSRLLKAVSAALLLGAIAFVWYRLRKRGEDTPPKHGAKPIARAES